MEGERSRGLSVGSKESLEGRKVVGSVVRRIYQTGKEGKRFSYICSGRGMGETKKKDAALHFRLICHAQSGVVVTCSATPSRISSCAGSPPFALSNTLESSGQCGTYGRIGIFPVAIPMSISDDGFFLQIARSL
jgi:hypothetical protein